MERPISPLVAGRTAGVFHQDPLPTVKFNSTYGGEMCFMVGLLTK